MAKSTKTAKPKTKIKSAKAPTKAPAKAKAAKKVAKSATSTRRDAGALALAAARMQEPALRPMPPLAIGASSAVLDRLWGVVMARRDANPASSHSARLLSRGTAKVAQKFGEEAVECLIEAVAGNTEALVAESADVLYHLVVLWVNAGIRPDDVWSELHRREGVSGIAEKSSRVPSIPAAVGLRTAKIP